MYNDPVQRPLLRKYMFLLIFGAIIWIAALILLIYYWMFLETWARVVGIAGLFFNVGGSLLTILVVFFGMKDMSLLSTSTLTENTKEVDILVPSTTESSLPTIPNSSPTPSTIDIPNKSSPMIDIPNKSSPGTINIPPYLPNNSPTPSTINILLPSP